MDDIRYLDEQLEEIKRELATYRKRYPMLDVAYEYAIWALELRKKGSNHPHIKYDWMQWLEKRKRQADAGTSRVSIDDALSDFPQIAEPFKRLVAAFRIDPYLSVDTIRVYAEEFATVSKDDFAAICQQAIRNLDRFPTVAALLRIQTEMRSQAATDKAQVERQAEARKYIEAAERSRAIEKRIAALPEEEREQLENDAMLLVGAGNNLKLGFEAMLAKKRMLSLYEERYGVGGNYEDD